MLCRLRESGRDELFDKAKGEILDEVVTLSQISAKKWDDALTAKLWEKLSNYVFENVYLPAAQSGSQSNIFVVIKLKVLRKEHTTHLPLYHRHKRVMFVCVSVSVCVIRNFQLQCQFKL